jgi:DNA-binding transcriptional LysR family regulator
MPVEIRQLRYFVALAEELNFTRAAQRLHVVQQSLSMAIAQLEAMLGVRLFERSTRAVSLTAAGEAWLPYAREALRAADGADAAARALAAGRAGRLRVGLAATAAIELTPRLLRAFSQRRPDVELAAEHADFEDPSGGLRDGRADVALVRPPFTSDGLELTEIAAEPRLVALAADDALAARPHVRLAEIEDRPWLDIRSDPVWCAFWRASAQRAAPPRIGPRGGSLEDILEAARSGRAVGLVPASVARAHAWPGLAFVEVSDIPPSTIAVARRAADASPLVGEFVELAVELCAHSNQ